MKKTARILPLLVAATLASIDSFAQPPDDATPRADFSMKEEGTQTGTNIRRDAVTGGYLPYDKTYAELSAEQQRMFKSHYMVMPPEDEPPYPVDGLGPLYKAISKANELAGAGLGKLQMEVLVDASGAATKVEILRSPDPKLSKMAGTVAMLTKFKPAICSGKPCAMGFPVSITFVRR